MRKVIHTIILACFLLANLQLFSVETLPVLDNNPLPSIGKWMEIQHGGFAHWLGLRYANKELREPINIVIIDSYSASRAEASPLHKIASSVTPGSPASALACQRPQAP